MKLRRLFSSIALFLAGCAGMGYDNRSYPSLTRRPSESQNIPATAPVTSPQTESQTASADVSADFAAVVPKLDALSAQGHEGEAEFDASYGRVSDQVRSATDAAIASEAWVAANLGISTLESARNGSVSALASLDRLYADRLDSIAQGKAAGGADRIDVVRRQVLAIVDAQNDKLDRLKAALRQP